jgi:hypothetical protein
MNIRCDENHRTRSAGIETFANGGAVGVAKSEKPILLQRTPAEKSGAGFVDANIHCLSSRRLVQGTLLR